MNNNEIRDKIKESATLFKKNWTEFAKILHDVHIHHLYNEWGYKTIVDYAKEELKIKKDTIFKLLSSIEFFQNENIDISSIRDFPSFESISALQKIKDKISQDSYDSLKKDVMGKNISPSTIYKRFIEDTTESANEKVDSLHLLSDEEIKKASHYCKKLEELLFRIDNLPEHIKESLRDIQEYLES